MSRLFPTNPQQTTGSPAQAWFAWLGAETAENQIRVPPRPKSLAPHWQPRLSHWLATGYLSKVRNYLRYGPFTYFILGSQDGRCDCPGALASHIGCLHQPSTLFFLSRDRPPVHSLPLLILIRANTATATLLELVPTYRLDDSYQQPPYHRG